MMPNIDWSRVDMTLILNLVLSIAGKLWELIKNASNAPKEQHEAIVAWLQKVDTELSDAIARGRVVADAEAKETQDLIDKMRGS